MTSQPNIFHSSTPASILEQQSTTSQATPTAALSAALSHSPLHTGNGRASSDRVSVDSFSVGVGGAGALLLLTTVPVVLITVLVCLKRRNNKLKTTENVAYLNSNSVSQTNMANNLTSQDSLCPYTSDLLNPTQNEVYNGHTSSSDVTDICIPTFTNQAYGNNCPTSNTEILTSTNQAYLEDVIYEDANIPTSTNQSYLQRSCQSGSDSLTYDYIRT